MADDELLDVYDELGAHLGVERRDVVHRDGLWHRGFHLWVVSRDAVVLQRRSVTKAAFGGLLDATAAGHVGAGESVLAGGAREVAEELGVRYDTAAIVPLGVRAIVDHPTPATTNREFQHVFVVADPRPLEAFTAFDRVELDGLVRLGLRDFTAAAHGLGPGPWPAVEWDGSASVPLALTAADLLPQVYLPVLAIMLERFAAGEHPLAV